MGYEAAVKRQVFGENKLQTENGWKKQRQTDAENERKNTDDTVSPVLGTIRKIHSVLFNMTENGYEIKARSSCTAELERFVLCKG